MYKFILSDVSLEPLLVLEVADSSVTVSGAVIIEQSKACNKLTRTQTLIQFKQMILIVELYRYY